jgi:phosphomevalonate kinase
VTSFTAAVLGFYLEQQIWDIDSEEGKRVLHNLAQASHSFAQGKVGSGFDIASAVYGSCLYKRFSPSLLSALPAPGHPGFATKLKELVEGDTWDTEIRKAAIKMPEGLRLVMCDVDCGSETPGMVKQVLKWRQENKEEADKMWGNLQAGNEALAEELTRLATTEPTFGDDYKTLRSIIDTNRALIRQMSVASGVSIEPPQQTALLDGCSKIDGVLGGVVPGAGGFDAIVLIVENREEVLAALKQSLAEQDQELGKVGIIGVREEMVGVRTEDVKLYQDWAGNA